MTKFQELYYNEQREVVQYSSFSGGSFDVGEFSRGRPFWKRTATDSETRPKALILSDWSASQWTFSTITALQQQLQHLLDKGFSLYVWQDGQVLPLTKDKLSRLNHQSFRDQIVPALPADILDCAIRQHGLSRDHIQLIDDYWLDYLLQDGVFSAERTLNLSAWLDAPQKQHELQQLIKHAHPPYSRFVQSTIEPYTSQSDRVALLKKAWPGIPTTNTFKRSKIDASTESERAKQGLPDSCTGMEEILIEDLNGDGEHAPGPGLVFPRLNELTLFDWTLNLLPKLKLEEGKWPDLKSLQVELHTGTSWEAFTHEFLDHFPNLCHLHLSSYNSDVLIDFAPDSSLSRLESLHVRNLGEKDPGIRWNSLKHLPELQHLSLDTKTAMSELTDTVLLPALIQFTLTNQGSVLDQQLQNRLLGASLLEELSLNLELMPGFSRGLNVSRLSRLSIYNHTISLEDLAYLLSSPLKKLHLSQCNTLPDGFTTGKDFSQLQTLDLSDSTISLDDLKRILQQATQLKALDLSGHTIPKGFFKSINLSHLQSLTLNDVRLDQDDLNDILSQTKDLRSLTLAEYKQFRPNTSSNYDLPRLEKLYVSRSNISFFDFEHIISKAPLLSEVVLTSAQQLVSHPRIAEVTAHIPTRRGISQTTYEVSTSAYEVSTSAPQPETQPGHTLDAHRRFKPKPADTPFVFKGDNHSQNQTMIIEKLSQYLSLTGQHLDVIPAIQDGICAALSYAFLATSPADWTAMLSRLQHWDGQMDSLNQDQQLQADLQKLCAYVLRYQLVPMQDNTFVGKSLDLLAAQSDELILVNPWHAIAAKRVDKDHWLLYDPVFTEGPVSCAESELTTAVELQLGILIAVYDNRPWPATVPDASSFIHAGGLFTLRHCCNAPDLLAQLNAADEDVTPEALSGLLLRNVSGKPAWMQAMMLNYTASLALNLLASFVEHYPYKELLQESLEVVSGYDRYELIAALREQHHLNPDLVERLCRLLRKNTAAPPSWAQGLQGSRQHQTNAHSPLAYCQQLLHGEGNKQVIDLSSSAQARALSLQLQRYCHDTGRPYFYIDNFNDLDCLSDYIRQDGQRGTLVPGPGGPLHAYLQACEAQGQKPLLIVNCDLFNALETKSFISLLSPDGGLLPASSTVIALFNPDKPGCYQGEDFYPAFDERDVCPLNTEVLTSSLPGLPDFDTRPAQAASSKAETAVPLKLYHSADWKARLLGRWIMQNNEFFFQEGLLTAALRSGSPITIDGGLWNDPAFVSFWQQARMSLPIRHEGFSFQLPTDAVFRRSSQGYDWQALTSNARFESGLVNEAQTVNPALLGSCFLRWHCDNEQRSLNAGPGFIEQQTENSKWQVNITRSLSEDEWAMLLDACQHQSLQPRFHLGAGVELPPGLVQYLAVPNSSSKKSQPLEWQGQHDDPLIIHSQDLDSSIQMLTEGETDWMILDISECHPDDLLLHLSSEYQPDSSQRYRFLEEERVLITALQAGRRVLLKGRFSADLVDALAPVLLARQQADNKNGQLVLISEDARDLAFANPLLHRVDESLKTTCLQQRGYSDSEIAALSQEQRSKEALSRLVTRLDFLRQHPGQSSDDAWKGMDGLSPRILLDEFDADNSADKAQAFVRERVHSIHQIWQRSPYVFLAGLTATGKTTLVENELIQPGDSLYRSEKDMEAWARDQHSLGHKILFIDEANLSPRQWSELEGLFNNPPSILINGQHYMLSDQHKVVFAGNPLNYGGGRRLAPFFQRHGQSLVFEPMPLEFIYEKILKPAFADSALEQDALSITQPFLEVYRYLCERSTSEVLISPRELQMMALLTLSAAERNPGIDPHELARFYAYQLAKALVPDASVRDFCDRFAASYPMAGSVTSEDHLIPESRQDCSQLMDDLLALRQRRQTQPGNDAQQYGGLGGIMVEGSPSSEHIRFIRHKLQTHGEGFYHLTASMSQDKKKTLALQAWRKGAILFNEGPLDERFLNDLAMGKNPDTSDGKPLRADKPGFLFIGTRDPATMSHRVQPGNAVARRFIATSLRDYTEQELRATLINDGLLPEDAKIMVNLYLQQQNAARQQASQTAPALAQLKRVAKAVVSSPDYGKPKLEYNSLEIDKRASLFIEEELQRLRSARKTMFKTGSGQMNTPMIQAIEALQTLVNQNPPDKPAMLKDWYRSHEKALTRPSGPDNSFFSPNQRTSTQHLISTLCECYQVDEADLPPRLNPNP